MIAPLLLALLQLPDTVTALHVRDGDRRVRVPIVFTAAGPMVSSSAVFPLLAIRTSRPSRDRFVLDAAGGRVELTMGLRFARIGGQTAQLTSAPVERGGEVYVPLAVVIEVLPRHVPGYAWDARRVEVSRFTPSVRAVSTGEVARPAATTAARTRPVDPPRKPVVVVDAGHGGPDRGMSGPMGSARKIYEADITLAVARRLRDELKSRGVDVIMTRTRDTLIALRDRGRIANRNGGTLFLSIHVNAANPRWSNPRGARGFETFFLADAKTEAEKRVEQMENESMRYEVDLNAEPGDPLSFILTDMIQNENLRESSELAESIQGGLRRVHPGTDRGVKQAGFAVLVTTNMPAALVEIGFGTNAAEAQYLSSARGQQTLAGAIADATMKYLADYDRRTTGTGTR
jgi:N-acetylmuramoyl-L-alanine amidase